MARPRKSTVRRDEPLVPLSYSSGPHWFVVQVMAKTESRVRADLLAQGHRAHFPEFTKWVTHARLRSVVKRPLFPRYVFVEVDPDRQGFGGVATTDGVEFILSSEGVPVTIPGVLVEVLIKRQLKGEFDFAARESIQRWSKVKIMDGPHDDELAVIQNISTKGGGEVLLKLIETNRHVRLSKMWIQPAA